MTTLSHRVLAITLATMCVASACSGGTANGATPLERSAPAGNGTGTTPNISAVIPDLRPGLSKCEDLDSWPDAAECLRKKSDEEALRLEQAFVALAGSIDTKSKELLENSQSAWSRLVEADRAIEALIYDPLGPAGYFEAASNDAVRTCSRAEQIEEWLALAVADARTVSSEASVGAAPPAGNCMPLASDCINSSDSPDGRLDQAYLGLARHLAGESGELLAQSQEAWRDLQVTDVSFEQSTSLALPDLSKLVRTCERVLRLEGYRFAIE